MRTLRLSILLAYAACAAAAGAQGLFEPSAAPPPGFEHLTETQTTLVDVYSANRLIASTLAQYTLTHVEFLQPDDIVAALPDLLDPATLLDALQQPLSTHADRLCHHSAQTDCGTLAPDTVGIIFDEDQFRADLFIHPAALRVQRLEQDRFLPPPSDAQWASVHQVSAALAGGAEEDNAFDLSATSVLSRGTERMVARYDATRAGFAFSELMAQRDHNGYRYEAGLFRSRGQNAVFVGEQNVVGVRAGTALDLRADLDSAEATPIFLFLNQRSRVDVFRGDRLIDSRFYAPGNQQLDTARLPEGAYDLRVRIRGDNGRTREENFFYVRSTQLPPLDQPVYYAEAGTLNARRDAPAATLEAGTWLRAGAARRLNNALGLDAEFLRAGRTTLAQAGVFGFGSTWQMRASAMLTTTGDRGLWWQARTRGKAWSAGLDLRLVSVGRTPREPGQDLFSESFRQTALTFNAPLGKGRLTLRAQHDLRATAQAIRGWGANFALPLPRRGDIAFDLNADISVAGDDRLARIGVQARWRRHQRFNTVEAGFQHATDSSASSGPLLLDARSTRQSQHARLGQITHTTFIQNRGSQRVLGSALTSESELGRASADIQYANSTERSGMSYSATARFGVLSNRDDVALGGRQGESAAVVINVDGHAGGSFDVLVDDQRVATTRGRARTVIALMPYATYDIRVVPRGDTMAQISETAHTVTLYPGNVHSLDFNSRTVTVVVGQATWENGEPVANARFDYDADAAQRTDDQGWFQIELESLAPLTLSTADGRRCRLPISSARSANHLIVLPPATCESIPATP
ncbi:MAG: TcfC E-set like domain-containing protein [Gammaproteobacteria bacterium]